MKLKYKILKRIIHAKISLCISVNLRLYPALYSPHIALNKTTKKIFSPAPTYHKHNSDWYSPEEFLNRYQKKEMFKITFCIYLIASI